MPFRILSWKFPRRFATITPIVKVLLFAKPAARRLGLYPNCSATSRTLFIVSADKARLPGWIPLIACEAVLGETPAILATSFSVTAINPFCLYIIVESFQLDNLYVESL
jgi:hypothetical protein